MIEEVISKSGVLLLSMFTTGFTSNGTMFVLCVLVFGMLPGTPSQKVPPMIEAPVYGEALVPIP